MNKAPGTVGDLLKSLSALCLWRPYPLLVSISLPSFTRLQEFRWLVFFPDFACEPNDRI